MPSETFDSLPLGSTITPYLLSPVPGNTCQPPNGEFWGATFVWTNGISTNTGYARIQNKGAAGGSAHEVVVNNINLCFGAKPCQVLEGIQFNFGEYGGNLNLMINRQFVNFSNFQDIHGQIIGGVKINVLSGGRGNDSGEVGFILPEQVHTGSDIEPLEIYRVKDGDQEVIGWYFEATLRQPFNYEKYPFDHKTVWVRMWPRDFLQNIVLIPDFEAYKNTGIKDTFGIEQSIVLGVWRRANTYFDYKLSTYDTNFGLDDSLWQDNWPELRYNFVIKRKFENAFIVYLLPLLLVAALLFAAMLTVTENDKLSSRLGFSTAGFIGASSALFFVVMLSHIQLRQQFAGTSIVYIEYFYILMYAMLVLATANTYMFSIRASRLSSILLYKDNIIPKVAYWPVLIGILIVITLWFI